MPLEDGTYGYIDGKEVVLFDKEGNRIPFTPIKIDWDIESAEKKGYPHFMLKEIHEQPQTIQDALRGRIDIAKSEIVMPELDSLVDKLKTAKKVYITACGTAFHAGLILKYLLKTYTDLSVEADVGSEFRYMPWDLSRDKDDSIAVVISQSGETADTIAAMRLIKSYDIPVIGIVNVVGSTIYRESDVPLVINAGPEIAVASTKAYTNQLIVGYLLAMYIAKLRGFIDKQFEHQFVSDMLALPNLISTVLGVEETVKDIALNIKDSSNIFFIGRLLDHLINMEGSLKLKEISYIHSEAIQAGELKHGPLALISEGTPVIATVLQDRVKEKQISNIIEVRARKAKTIVLGYRDDIEAQSVADMFIGLPRIDSLFAPIAGIIPLQLLAYHVAVMRGNNVDKPRNLAKSVTVE
jgi:glucosamine--fructose-6-phosphate aminotransferase (isomerizing)